MARVVSDGAADWAAHPRQIVRRTNKERRKSDTRNRLNMKGIAKLSHTAAGTGTNVRREPAEAQDPQSVLAAFHDAERFARHRTAILNARRKACRGGFVPDLESRLMSESTDLMLREPCFEQGRGYVVLAGGLLSRAEVAL